MPDMMKDDPVIGDDEVDWSEKYGRDFSDRYLPGQVLGR